MLKELNGFAVDENIFIWRYLDFPKFISLLHKKKLFFSKANKFNDRYEGATTEANITSRRSEFPNIPKDDFQSMLTHMEIIKNHIFVNCWQVKNVEMSLMWGQYVKSKVGVAINSTYKNLKKSLFNNSNINIYSGGVKYIDYTFSKFNELEGFQYFLHKRKNFEDENELRTMVLLLPHELIKIASEDKTKQGIFLPVNLEVLINKIVISPYTELWIKDLIESLLYDLNLNKKVELSELTAIPPSD